MPVLAVRGAQTTATQQMQGHSRLGRPSRRRALQSRRQRASGCLGDVGRAGIVGCLLWWCRGAFVGGGHGAGHLGAARKRVAADTWHAREHGWYRACTRGLADHDTWTPHNQRVRVCMVAVSRARGGAKHGTRNRRSRAKPLIPTVITHEKVLKSRHHRATISARASATCVCCVCAAVLLCAVWGACRWSVPYGDTQCRAVAHGCCCCAVAALRRRHIDSGHRAPSVGPPLDSRHRRQLTHPSLNCTRASWRQRLVNLV